MYANIKSLDSTTETNIILYIYYIVLKKSVKVIQHFNRIKERTT